MESTPRSKSLVEHDLFGKPVPTFPDHALDLDEHSVFGRLEGELATARKHVVAHVREDQPFRADLPHFQSEEVEGIVALLERRFLKERHEPRLRVWLDGKRIPMKDFVQDIIIQGIMGMLGTLRGFIPAGRVDLTLSPQKPATEGKPKKND